MRAMGTGVLHYSRFSLIGRVLLEWKPKRKEAQAIKIPRRRGKQDRSLKLRVCLVGPDAEGR